MFLVQLPHDRNYASKFSITAQELEETEAAATTTAYTSYMLNVSQRGGVENTIAAVLDLNWVSGFFQGDFGQSFVHKMPASELILSRLPNTILLAVVAMIITYIVSFLMGRYAGRHPYTLGDYGVQVLNYLALYQRWIRQWKN